jgi:hypothetical protein
MSVTEFLLNQWWWPPPYLRLVHCVVGRTMVTCSHNEESCQGS